MTTLMVQTNRLLDNFKRIKKAAGSDIIPVLSGNGSGFGDTAIGKHTERLCGNGRCIENRRSRAHKDKRP